MYTNAIASNRTWRIGGHIIKLNEVKKPTELQNGNLHRQIEGLDEEMADWHSTMRVFGVCAVPVRARLLYL